MLKLAKTNFKKIIKSIYVLRRVNKLKTLYRQKKLQLPFTKESEKQLKSQFAVKIGQTMSASSC